MSIYTITIDLQEILTNCFRQFLLQARAFRENNHVLTNEEFEQLKAYFIETLSTNEFYAENPKKDEPINPFDPNSNEAIMQMAKEIYSITSHKH